MLVQYYVHSTKKIVSYKLVLVVACHDIIFIHSSEIESPPSILLSPLFKQSSILSRVTSLNFTYPKSTEGRVLITGVYLSLYILLRQPTSIRIVDSDQYILVSLIDDCVRVEVLSRG